MEIPDYRLTADMGYMFEQSLFTDFTIKCEDRKEFKVS